VSVTTVPTLEAAVWQRLPGVEAVQPASGGAGVVTFATARPVETLAALAALIAERRVELVELQVRKASLEDVFVGLTKTTEGAT
jgi:hypothetical protein